MDTLTHAMVGACVARATAPSARASEALGACSRVGIGALAAAFPDIDYATALVNPLAFISQWHRSITHSLVMLPLWAIVLGCALAWLFRAPRHRMEIMLICGLSLMSHILTDLITSWGTQIFAPVAGSSPAFRLTFIIDPYFSSIIALALLLALLKHSRLAARAGLAVLALYIGLLGVLKSQAHEIGQAYLAGEDLQDAAVHTLPQPLSPFNWKIIIVTDSNYHVALVNLLRREPGGGIDVPLLRMMIYYLPPGQLEWSRIPRIGAQPEAARVWAHPALSMYRAFADFPFVIGRTAARDEVCFWFADLRFQLPGLRTPFRYGMCRHEQGNDWRLYRLAGDPADSPSRQAIPDPD